MLAPWNCLNKQYCSTQMLLLLSKEFWEPTKIMPLSNSIRFICNYLCDFVEYYKAVTQSCYRNYVLQTRTEIFKHVFGDCIVLNVEICKYYLRIRFKNQSWLCGSNMTHTAHRRETIQDNILSIKVSSKRI